MQNAQPGLRLSRPAQPGNVTSDSGVFAFAMPRTWLDVETSIELERRDEAAALDRGPRVFEADSGSAAELGASIVIAGERARHYSRRGLAIAIFGRRFVLVRNGRTIASVFNPGVEELSRALRDGLAREEMAERLDAYMSERGVVEEAAALDVLVRPEHPGLADLADARAFLFTGGAGRFGPALLRLVDEELARRAGVRTVPFDGGKDLRPGDPVVFDSDREVFAGLQPARLADQLCQACGNRAEECLCGPDEGPERLPNDR